MSVLKRIIFCLYYQDGFFYISRNFRLQKVGDSEWIIKNFGFDKTSNHIDELIIILVKKEPSYSDFNNFLKDVFKLKKNIFIPITLGGGIRDYKISKKYFDNGADKILINTLIYSNKTAVEKIADVYGSQAICVMIDYKTINGQPELYSFSGTHKESINFKDHLKYLNNSRCGEIILNSIDNDGNAEGINLSILKKINQKISQPILIMGGAGKPEHLVQALNSEKISGVITANLFNFLGEGLKIARLHAIKKKIPLAKF